MLRFLSICTGRPPWDDPHADRNKAADKQGFQFTFFYAANSAHDTVWTLSCTPNVMFEDNTIIIFLKCVYVYGKLEPGCDHTPDAYTNIKSIPALVGIHLIHYIGVEQPGKDPRANESGSKGCGKIARGAIARAARHIHPVPAKQYDGVAPSVVTVLMDREFEPLRSQIHGTMLNTTVASEHVPEIDRQIRVIK
jgi:hypothetical protein